MSVLLANPLILLGAILLLGPLLGDAAERLRVPWITGCIVTGVALGPGVTGVLAGPAMDALSGFTQAALAVIAFNIGSQLVIARLRAIGRSILLLAFAQLLAPFVLVLAGEAALGLTFPAVLILAAVSPATAPTTTYSVIRRLDASGPFVDRVMGVLAVNDAATVLLFSVVSATAVALLGAQGPGSPSIAWSLLAAVGDEAASAALGLALGAVYLVLRRLIEDGRPGWEGRLTAMLLGLMVASIGAAVSLGLSHLLVPLALGAVVANGVDGAERQRVHELIRGIEEPLFIVFFVLAGAHLPLDAARHGAILASAAVYLAARFGGKYVGIRGTAAALGLDRATGRYLGLCFPSQGALAMGLVLALHGSATPKGVAAGALEPIETAISIVLVAVLVSQMVGPVLIDFAVRRGGVASAPGDPG